MVLGIGFAIITIGNLLGLGPWWLAIAVSAAMGGFAYSVRDVDVSGDAKGDSIYYLGLLFTFVALVAALIAFDWETSDAAGSSTSGAIRNFGIALLTTIVGLAGRVWFSMSQESPGDIAHTTKSALEEAVSAMKGSLDRARDDIDTLADKFRESAKDMGETTDTIAATAEKAVETSRSLDEYTANIAGAALSFTDGMGDFRNAVGAGTAAADKLKESLAGIGSQAEVFGDRFNALSEQLQQAHSTFSGINAVARPTADAIGAASRGVAEAAAEAALLPAVLAGFRKSTGKAAKAFDGIESADENPVGAAFSEAARGARAAGQRLDSIASQATRLDDAMDSIANSANKAQRGMAGVSSTVQSVADRMARAEDHLSDDVAAVQQQAKHLNADLAALGDGATDLAGALAGAKRETREFASEVKAARKMGFAGSSRPSNALVSRIARAFRRIVRWSDRSGDDSRR